MSDPLELDPGSQKKLVPHAVPEVEGPNTRPSPGEFDTAIYNYAAGYPPTPTVTDSARRARARILGLDIAES